MCDFMKVFKVHVVSGMFFDVSSEKILDVGYNNKQGIYDIILPHFDKYIYFWINIYLLYLSKRLFYKHFFIS